MLRIVALCLGAALLLDTGMITKLQFEKYRKVEAYEVRPGLLMMPRYASDDQICEIGLQPLMYSPELIRVDSGLSRKEIDQILDELVPAGERGSPSKSPSDSLITEGGQSMVTSMDFENVVIHIYGATAPSRRKGAITTNEVVATVKWKKRTCR
jgi:hypothetical protein